jgi:hypothetical protein
LTLIIGCGNIDWVGYCLRQIGGMIKKEEVGMKLVDMDTGQVFENVVKLTTHKQDEGLKKKKLMSEKNKEFVDEYGNFFFKTISKRTTKMDDKLKDSDVVRLLYIATYLDYENDLRLDCGKRVNKAVLKELIGANDKTFTPWYNIMISKKILNITEYGLDSIEIFNKINLIIFTLCCG